MENSPKQVAQKPGTRKKGKLLWAALAIFIAYIAHLYIIYGSFEFITEIFQGDLIRIGSLVLTAWVVGGWYLLSRLFKNLN